MDVLLNGTPVGGSPITFKCVAGFADAANSYVSVPEGGKLYADLPYEFILTTADAIGNRCKTGGAGVTARLQPDKSSSSMPEGQEANVDVDDMGDGTYLLDVELIDAAEILLIITINGHGREPQTLQPVPLSFMPAEPDIPPPPPVVLTPPPPPPVAEKPWKDSPPKKHV